MDRTGTARRVTATVARRALEAGAEIAVSDRGLEEFPITGSSVTHHRTTTTWGQLAGLVDMWRNRYPGQAYYVVERAS